MERRTAVIARCLGQQLALLLLLLISAVSAWGATIPDGTFPSSTSWTFSTAVFDATTRTADGTGSARLATVSKGVQNSGTARHAVSIPAGSVINAASLYSQLVFVGGGSATGNTVSVDLHYTGGSTVNILNTGNLTAHTWTVRNGTVPVTLAQDVDQVIITMTALSGSGGGTQTANIYIDEVTISYNPYSNPLLHNSTNLGQKYWSASNGWGVAAGQYGEFTCTTCHNKSTTNIKRVAGSIPATIGTALVKPVSFRNVTAFGNDAGGHTTSQRICEVCHTQTTVHKYNQTTGDLNHKNANLTDCTSCHAHNKSFGASCDTCHGYPPINATLGTDGLASPATGILTAGDAGAHATHVNVRGIKCETCHQGYTQNPMGNQHIELGFNVTGETAGYKGTFTGGTFASKTPYSPYSSNATYTGTTVNMGTSNTNTCSTVYCHGGYAGSNGSLTTPAWTASGASAKACGACHGVSQATPPTSGQHVRHTGTAAGNMGIACSDCHGTIPADNAHVNGNVVTQLNAASKLRANATYKGFANQSSAALAYGTCSLYCHSTVQSADALTVVTTSTIQPKWDDPAYNPASCGTSQCHGNPPANANHSVHVSKGYDCAVCHSGAGKDTAKHADYNIDVAFSGVAGSGTYSQSPNTPGNGFGSCSATYCHSGAATAPTWGGLSMPADCTGCHGNEVTAATKLSGAHNAHLNNASQGGVFFCNTCHAPTNNTANNRSITNSTLHVNGMVNYSGLYAGKNATCSNIYCHSTGKGTFVNPPTWASGTLLYCNGCHGSTGNTSGMPTPDAVGVNSHTKHLPTQDTTKCVYCHRTTVNGSNAIIAGSQHINAARDVRFSKPNTFTNNSGVYNAGARTCSTTYCHGTAVSDAWGTAGPLACNKCHESSNALPGAHVIHYNTATVATGLYGAAPGTSSQSATAYQFACSACHGTDTSKHANFPATDVSDATIFFGFSSAGRGALANSAYAPQAIGSTDLKGYQWTTGGNGNCTATYCHSNGRGSNGGSTTVNWGITARDASCSTCHGNASTTIAGTNPTTTPTMLSGAHKAHIGNATQGGVFTCTDCHANTLSGATTIAANAYSKHVNKFVDYSGLYAGKNKTCSNIYCHSTGKGTFVNPPTWASGTTLGCNGCHGSTGNASGMPTPDAVGVNSHTKHLPTQDTTKCVYCHRTTVNGTNAIIAGSQHINAARDVRFSKPNTFTNNSGAYNAGTRTCSTTYCHGTAASDAWGTAGPLACNKCHDASNALPGAHVIHYNTATVATGLYGAAPGTSSQSATAYQFACSACHGTDTSKHANFPATDVSDATIFFGFSSVGRGALANSAYVPQLTGSTDLKGYQWTTGGNANCTATYCHSNGRGSNGGSTTVNWGITARDASCSTCHGNATTTNAGTNPTTTPTMLSGAHKAHIGSASTGGGFACIDCHATTVSSNTAIATNSYNKHVNKFVDYSGAYAGKNKTCSNIYCHTNGKGTPVNPPTWTSGSTLDCSGCHGSTSANLISGSHNAHLVAGATCQNCHWNTTQANGTITAVAQHINRTAGVNQGSTFKTVAVSFTGTTSCSAISCHSNGTSGGATAATWGSTLKCDGCHPNLSAAHTVHANLNLNTGVTFYNYTAIKSTGSEAVNGVKYGFGCGTCHPLVESTYHIDGSVQVQLDPATAGAGALRQKNGVGAVMNADKSCDLVYCHSDGKNAMVSGPTGNGHAPVWTTTFATLGGDRCAKCHGNSPQTAAHNAHQVGIHYDNVYNGTSGKLAAAVSGSSSHGVAGQSTTITCNVCHYKTMTNAANDQNTLCNTCHTKGTNGALVKGNAQIADFAIHVNGKKDISFLTSLKVVSKAQLRQTSFSNYSGLWVRNGGNYKNGVNAFDTAKTALTDTMWNSTAGTCSNISCHNLRVGETVNWTDTTISCNSCHSKL